VATILSILALVVAGASALFAFWAYRASRQSADAATSSERRERQPSLAVEIEIPGPPPADKAIYRLRNDGPDDLDSVVIFRPRVKTGTTYPLAVTSRGTGWADDEIELGPLALGEETLFTLCCGSADELPEFRVRVETRSGPDSWKETMLLANPRQT